MNTQYHLASRLLFLLLSLLSGCNARSQHHNCDKKDTLNYIATQHGCLFIKVFKSDSISAHPNLLVIIHGDAPFNPPIYQYKLSQKLSEQVKNTVIVSVLRPGYKDNEGNQSDGNRGLTTGDNYTQEVINSLTTVITQLKDKFKASRTLLTGHSGGATISADIVSISPELVDQVILVSCPCDVDAFRKSMASKQPFYKPWRDRVNSISPIDVVDKININTEFVLIHGNADRIVPFKIIEDYNKKLQEHRIKSELIVIENEGHEIFLSDTVISVLKRILNPKLESSK